MADYSFSTGIEEFSMNGTTLKVNLSDNNLYYRFMGVLKDLEEMEKEYVEQTREYDGKVDISGLPTTEDEDIDIEALTEEQKQLVMERTKVMVGINMDIDRRIKEKLKFVFGEDNDFDAIFQGVNVMAFDNKGNRILSNFLNTITPLIEKALKITDNEVSNLVGNREQRRARNKRANKS